MSSGSSSVSMGSPPTPEPPGVAASAPGVIAAPCRYERGRDSCCTSYSLMLESAKPAATVGHGGRWASGGKLQGQLMAYTTEGMICVEKVNVL